MFMEDYHEPAGEKTLVRFLVLQCDLLVEICCWFVVFFACLLLFWGFFCGLFGLLGFFLEILSSILIYCYIVLQSCTSKEL